MHEYFVFLTHTHTHTHTHTQLLHFNIIKNTDFCFIVLHLFKYS